MFQASSKRPGAPPSDLSEAADVGAHAGICRRARGLVEGLVNSRSWPTLLVNGSARVLSLNDAARTLLVKRADWIIGPNGEFRHRDAATSALLHARIRTLGDALVSTVTRVANFVEGSDGEQTLVTMTRIESPAGFAVSCCSFGESGDNVVLVALNDGHRQQVQQGSQLLFEAFAFTPAEARVAFALLDGMSLQAFSDEAGVRISTVRWHVRNALAKTNCANQRDLVRLLIALIDS